MLILKKDTEKQLLLFGVLLLYHRKQCITLTYKEARSSYDIKVLCFISVSLRLLCILLALRQRSMPVKNSHEKYMENHHQKFLQFH